MNTDCQNRFLKESPTQSDFHAILRERFGFDAFRSGQLDALNALFSSRRLLCIQPTGRGKSLLYQLPACLLDGIVLVISPLLALMRDQARQLKERFQIPAGSINSDQTLEENEAVLQAASNGGVRILFLSPEQLDHVDRFQFFLSLPLSLVVIDEAHCVSSWGHDFRPAFRQILQFVKAAEAKNRDIYVLGLTATAGPRVEEDICKQLFSAEHPGKVLRESMDRPNIALSVLPAHGMASKLTLLEEIVKSETSALIYCATRENAELVAEFLRSRGVGAVAYHAGMEPEEKRRIQEAFMRNEFQAIVATNALGMGIDKPDIRLILHFDIPGSITAYYQEVGRAGRDGLDARGILCFDSKDREIQEYFIHSAVPDEEDFNKVLEAAGGIGLVAIKQKTGLHPTRVNVILAELVEQQFLIKKSVDRKQVYCRVEKEGKPNLDSYEQQREVKLRELHAMLRYASDSEGCRMGILRKALGDSKAECCGRCDLCRPNANLLQACDAAAIDAWLAARPLSIAGSRTVALSDGISLLDGKLRLPLFCRFMRERQESLEIDPELMLLLQKHLLPLKIRAFVPLPSKTWKGRERVARAIAEKLGVPCYPDLLVWKRAPDKRQGELFNNDQRKVNVEQAMQVEGKIPQGPLLLFDDYTGSGATLREAARAIRIAAGRDVVLIPCTIAVVKWRLGKSGFI